MALTAEEQRELDTLELEQLEAEAAFVPQGSTGNTSLWEKMKRGATIPRALPPGAGTVPGDSGTFEVNPAQTISSIKNLGLEGGGAAIGQAVGAPFGPVGIGTGGAVGGTIGNIAAQLTTPGKDFSMGEAGGAFVSGLIPGGSLAKAGRKELLKAGGKYAATNLAAANVESLINTGKLASPEQDLMAAASGAASAPISKFLDKGMRAEAARVARQQDAVRRETLKAGRELGLVIPPPVVSPNAANNTLNSLAGKAATAQEAVLRNQPKINEAVRAEIGLPSDAPLSPITYNTAKVGPNLVYGQIDSTSPAASGLLSQFKSAMDEARELRAAYRAGIDAGQPNNAILAAARAKEVQADVFKQGIKQVVSPELYDAFDQARTQLAKIGLAERATRLGDGNVDAKVFGDALEHGEKLTGNFSKLGRFQSAFGKYVQEQAKTPPSGVDYLKVIGKFGLGGGAGYAAGGAPGAVAGAAAMAGAEKGARELILSPFYQQRFAQPYYGPSSEDFQAAMARYAAMSAGRNDPNN